MQAMEREAATKHRLPGMGSTLSACWRLSMEGEPRDRTLWDGWELGDLQRLFVLDEER